MAVLSRATLIDVALAQTEATVSIGATKDTTLYQDDALGSTFSRAQRAAAQLVEDSSPSTSQPTYRLGP